MMQQMMENPAAMQNFTSAPYVQSMIESMEQDPDMAMRLLNMNPVLSRNPQLQVCCPEFTVPLKKNSRSGKVRQNDCDYISQIFHFNFRIKCNACFQTFCNK